MRPLALLALAVALSGCAHRAVILSPPAEYLRPCPVPELIGSTNGALAQHDKDTQQALRACNDDKTAVREWVSEAHKKFK